MKVKNISARLHHVGGVSVAPGESVEIDACFLNAINKNELVLDEEPSTSGPKKTAKKTKSEED